MTILCRPMTMKAPKSAGEKTLDRCRNGTEVSRKVHSNLSGVSIRLLLVATVFAVTCYGCSDHSAPVIVEKTVKSSAELSRDVGQVTDVTFEKIEFKPEDVSIISNGRLRREVGYVEFLGCSGVSPALLSAICKRFPDVDLLDFHECSFIVDSGVAYDSAKFDESRILELGSTAELSEDLISKLKNASGSGEVRIVE